MTRLKLFEVITFIVIIIGFIMFSKQKKEREHLEDIKRFDVIVSYLTTNYNIRDGR